MRIEIDDRPEGDLFYAIRLYPETLAEVASLERGLIARQPYRFERIVHPESVEYAVQFHNTESK